VEEAKNVCITVKDSCSGKLSKEVDDHSNQYLARHLNLRPMPADFKGKTMQSGLLFTRAKHGGVDKKQTAFAQSDEEWSEAMMPAFEMVHELKQEMEVLGNTQGLFSAILMPQVPTALKFHSTGTFDSDVLDSLLETSGSSESAEKLFCEDMKKETEMCFNRLVHYRHSTKKEPSRAAAFALRKHAMLEKVHTKARKAVLLMRKDHLGWVNFVEVENKLRALLEEKCWSLAQVEHTDAPVQKAIDDLKSADLVIANHGPHNENLIWMPKNAGFIEDKNCKCSTYGYASLAQQQELHYAHSGALADEEQCLAQKTGQGICTKDKPRVVDFQTEIEPVVLNMLQELEKDRSDLPSNCRI